MVDKLIKQAIKMAKNSNLLDKCTSFDFTKYINMEDAQELLAEAIESNDAEVIARAYQIVEQVKQHKLH